MLLAGATGRAVGLDLADEPRTNDQKGPTAVPGDQALTCTYLVAGAGFEPATSGL
jgi:hypothetical protein